MCDTTEFRVYVQDSFYFEWKERWSQIATSRVIHAIWHVIPLSTTCGTKLHVCIFSLAAMQAKLHMLWTQMKVHSNK